MAEQSLGLFGPSVEELQAQRDALQQAYLMNAQKVSPYYGAGAGVGALLGNVVGSLFGIEAPEIKKAKAMDTIQKQIMEENPNLSDQGVFLDVAASKLYEAGFQKEALQAKQQADAFRKTQEATQLDTAVKQSTITKNLTDARAKEDAAEKERLSTEAIGKLWDEKQKEGKIPTSDELMTVTAKYIPAKDLTALMVGDENKKIWQNIQERQIQQAHEDKLARIEAMSDEKAKDRARQQEHDQFQRNTQLLIKQIGGDKGNQLVQARNENLMGSVGELGRSISIVANMGLTSSGGMFSGVQAGKTLFTAPLGAAGFALTSQQERQYNIAASNIGQALATIENGGYKPTQTQMTAYQDKLSWKPTDSIETKVFSLADAKEQAKARAKYSLANPNVPEEQKKILRETLNELDNVIPYSPEDVTNMKKKGISVSDWINTKQTGGNTAIPQGAIEKLKANPSFAKAFDDKYGAGASSKILGNK